MCAYISPIGRKYICIQNVGCKLIKSKRYRGIGEIMLREISETDILRMEIRFNWLSTLLNG
jgi:hypothetical protein